MRLIFLLFLLFIGLTIKAQDMIYLNNGDSIKCSISKDDGKDVYFEVNRKGIDVLTYIKKDSIKSVLYFKEDTVPYNAGKISLCVFGSFRALPEKINGYKSFGVSLGQFLRKELSLEVMVNYFEYSAASTSCFGIGPILTRYSNVNGLNPYLSVGALVNRVRYTSLNFRYGGFPSFTTVEEEDIDNLGLDMNVGFGLNVLIKNKVGIRGEMKLHLLLLSNNNNGGINTGFNPLFAEFVIGINGVLSHL